MNPDSTISGSDFTFRVLYKDTDNLSNTAPSTKIVYVDLNDDGIYDMATEKFTLSPEAGAGDYHDEGCSNGEILVSSPIGSPLSCLDIYANRSDRCH